MRPNYAFIAVQSISVSRALAGLVFVAIALLPGFVKQAAALYTYATLSDLLDGHLARRYHCATKIGQTLDLFGDKYLSIASVLYAAARGLPIIPCALIVMRELAVMALRAVPVHGEFSLLPPNRLVGGLVVVPLRVFTIAIILSADGDLRNSLAKMSLWAIASLSFGVFAGRVWSHRDRIARAVKSDLEGLTSKPLK